MTNDNLRRLPRPRRECPVEQLEQKAGELRLMTCQLRLYLLQRHSLSAADLDRVSRDMTRAFALGDRLEVA